MGKHKGLKSTPSQQRYNLEERWKTNKKRRIAKQAKKEARKAAKLAAKAGAKALNEGA